MKIKLSDLPADLRQRILSEAGVKPAAARPRRAPRRAVRGGMMKICSCLCEIFRPDGVYPETCDGCGRPRPLS
jgi:hypothetical protein